MTERVKGLPLIDREYLVRLRFPPTESAPGANVRTLRRILKWAKRSFGITAVSCEPAKDITPSGGSPGSNQPRSNRGI